MIFGILWIGTRIMEHFMELDDFINNRKGLEMIGLLTKEEYAENIKLTTIVSHAFDNWGEFNTWRESVRDALKNNGYEAQVTNLPDIMTLAVLNDGREIYVSDNSAKGFRRFAVTYRHIGN